MEEDLIKRRPFVLRAALFLFSALCSLCIFALFAMWLLVRPDSVLPDHWNPTRPLSITAPVTPVTHWQLFLAARDEAACRDVLARAGVGFSQLKEFTSGEHCGIAQRGSLSTLIGAQVAPVETRCSTALRLAMWEHHELQPAAKAHLGTDVSQLLHIGSYNCRKMRTSRGTSSGWSSHATARSFDITGVRLSDGRRLTLLKDWEGAGPEAAFMRQIWRGSCRWFRLVLGPEYNRLHADHFHLQTTGWGLCR
ncbi:extensin-like domain-containing protein [Aliiroseovarius halocynthiae]|uniref:Extensin family protein n=1 Tax=Aliiroseovarius halocynthiae TaxID=985055 RepID=A0A545SNJ4_9RHOB|nr:extensin family protein [Aliiroseovarius halocynthiae]TQV66552.1 extensin family protein [Aliiroseovarius halocynthiae]